MLNFICGALGAILVLLIFATGVYVGNKLNAHKVAEEAAKARKPETPEEAERRRLIEDQNASRCLMNYNVEMAYGMLTAKEFEGGET